MIFVLHVLQWRLKTEEFRNFYIVFISCIQIFVKWFYSRLGNPFRIAFKKIFSSSLTCWEPMFDIWDLSYFPHLRQLTLIRVNIFFTGPGSSIRTQSDSDIWNTSLTSALCNPAREDSLVLPSHRGSWVLADLHSHSHSISS